MKILTYYGSVQERELQRLIWTQPNAFHVCLTSYKLILQDAESFHRKRWKCVILDDSQFTNMIQSQVWQTLLDLPSQRRILLTDTSIGNSFVELKSLVQFLLPNLISSHEEFGKLFSNHSIDETEQEQNQTNDSLGKRFDTILRPFFLRRSKTDIESQMPKEHEHIITCTLSKRQRQLYDDLIQCKPINEMNTLMELRKICNHPNLFESRPIISPFVFEKHSIQYKIPLLITDVNLKNPQIFTDVLPNNKFLCQRIRLNLPMKKDIIPNNKNNRQRMQLTSSIIEKYRNTSIWNQTTSRI